MAEQIKLRAGIEKTLWYARENRLPPFWDKNMADEPSMLQSIKPSSSTMATSTIGLAAGSIAVYVINQVLVANGLADLPGEVAAAVGVLVAALVGLPFSGGRSETSV